MHEKKHTKFFMDPKFFVNDFVATIDGDLEFMRSPFYDLAKLKFMNNEEAKELTENIEIKNGLLDNIIGIINPESPTKDNVAYTRYADKFEDREP